MLSKGRGLKASKLRAARFSLKAVSSRGEDDEVPPLLVGKGSISSKLRAASPKLETAATFTVRCHCGAMRGEFKCNKTQITCWDCNCSDCGMRRNLHFILPSKAFKTTSDCERASTLYRWGTGVAQRRFCKTCGILPWYVPRSNPDGIGVSLSCVDWGTGERPSITIKKYDSQNWEQSHKETNIASESESTKTTQKMF